MKTIFVLTLLLASASVQAATLTILKPIPLQPFEGRFAVTAGFDERTPGDPREGTVVEGCQLYINYAKAQLPAGTYTVTSQTQGSPDDFYNQWWKEYRVLNTEASLEFSVNCHRLKNTIGHPITERYMNRVMQTFVRVRN